MPDEDSLASKVRAIETGSHVVAIHFVGEQATIATGEGEILIAGSGEALIKAHNGAILASAGDGARIFTAGDDGRLVATGADRISETLADAGGKWIDQVALGPASAIAWSVGKTAFVRMKKGDRSLELPSSVGGLSFAPKGLRLAIAHYNGATLWFPNAEAAPETLAWKGSHLGVLFSPDGRFLVTTMQEPALHGWRIADGQHMRMTGYPGRVRSLSFSADGDWLATSGAPEVILWPFRTRDGPMGKPPMTLAAGPKDTRVAAVAFHPKQPVLALGYSDGMVLLVRLEDTAEVLVSHPTGSPVSALAWRGDGRELAFGTEAGNAGLLAL